MTILASTIPKEFCCSLCDQYSESSLIFMNMLFQSIGPGEYQLKMGGLLYMLGVVFFKSDGTIPCAHAIWHLFVTSAAATHYFAILEHLYS